MAVFRNVNMSFWTDTKVIDDYTPEDKYFMLYALTNNYTNIIGCYEISIKQMSNDLGYTKDVVESLLKRFINTHQTLDYDFTTKELLVKNWSKYNWNASPKLDNPLLTAIEKVKSDEFHDYLATIYNSRESINGNDTLSIPYRYGMDTTITITSSIPITNTISKSNSINKKSDEKKLLTEEFEKLWEIYPKKQGKANALKKYIEYRTAKDETYCTFEEVLKGIENYNNEIKATKKSYQYIQMGSSWFNQRRWLDRYEPNQINNEFSNDYGGRRILT